MNIASSITLNLWLIASFIRFGIDIQYRPPHGLIAKGRSKVLNIRKGARQSDRFLEFLHSDLFRPERTAAARERSIVTVIASTRVVELMISTF